MIRVIKDVGSRICGDGELRVGVVVGGLIGLLCIQLIGGVPAGVLGLSGVGKQYEEFNFIAYGDTRSHAPPTGVSPVHEGLVTLYLQEDPEFVVHTGDMVMWGGIWDHWVEFNASIQGVWAAGIPFYGAVGNHEKYTSEWYVNDEDFSNYTTFFDYSSVVDEPGETELQYAFNHAGVHFVFLNTEDYFDDTLGGTQQFNCSSEQMSWLSNYLANTITEEFIVVTFHRTAWSILFNQLRWAEAQTIREDFHDLFVQYDVDLVLMGHDHYYYRTLRDGIYYVTTGGGGGPLSGINYTAPIWQSDDVAYSEYHYCNINVNSTHVTLTAFRSDHSLLDSFTIGRPSIPPLPPPIPIELLIIGLCLIVIIVIILIIYWVRKK